MLEIKDYQDALDAQYACNLSGVVISFREVIKKLWAVPGCTGTDFVNRHPISRLYAEQISHLSGGGMGDPDTYRAALTIAEEVVSGRHPVDTVF